MKAWTKGVSGNPGGRPKQYRETIDALFGQDARECYEFLRKVMRGQIQDATVTNRMDSAIFVIEQRHGKAVTRSENVDVSIDAECGMMTHEQQAERIAELAQSDSILAGKLQEKLLNRGIGGAPTRIIEANGTITT